MTSLFTFDDLFQDGWLRNAKCLAVVWLEVGDMHCGRWQYSFTVPSCMGELHCEDCPLDQQDASGSIEIPVLVLLDD